MHIYVYYIFLKVNFKELKRNNSELSMNCLGFFTSQIWYVFPLELDLQSAQVKPLPKGEFMFAHNELQLLLLRCLWYMKFLRTSVCLSGAVL